MQGENSYLIERFNKQSEQLSRILGGQHSSPIQPRNNNYDIQQIFNKIYS